MLKWLSILLLSSLPIMWGWMKSHQLQMHKQEVIGFLSWVQTCRQGISYQQLPICDLFQKMQQIRYPIIKQLGDLLKVTSPDHAWQRVSPQISFAPLAPIMDAFFLSLGTSDCDSQLKICDITIAQLEQMQAELEKETPTKAKLYRTIGALAGVFIAIILI